MCFVKVLNDASKTDLQKKLSNLIDDTEVTYTTLADIYPKLLEEVNNGFARSDKQISLIAAEGGNGLDALHMIMDKARLCIENAHSSFNDLSTEDARLLNILKESIGRLDILEELINAITFNTEEMELISLNAMVVALKAGHEGGGFSHVTDELRRISGRTINDAKLLTQEGKQIQAYFEDVQTTADNISGQQDAIFSKFGQKLFEHFKTIEERLTAIVNFFTELRSRAEDIQTSLYTIMEAIQAQDLIRQTIDHIKLTLEKVQDIELEDNNQDHENLILDEYTFLEQVANLGAFLLDNISSTIMENHETFITGIHTIRETVEDIEHERDTFVTRQIEGGDYERGISQLLMESEEELGIMLRDTRKVPKLKQTMRTANSSFIGRIQGLEEGFQNFANQIGRFRNINVAARIEVAKRQILKGMEATVHEMRELTDSIFGSVEQALSTTTEFIESAQEAEAGFKASYRQETVLVETFTSDIQQLYGKLKDTNNEIVSTMRSFSLFTYQFREIFGVTGNSAENLKALSLKARGIMELFEKTARNASARKDHIIKERGIETWEIHEQRLQETVQEFTIYAHKARAGEIAGFAVEEGTTEGDVTFF